MEGFELSADEGHLNLGWDRALEALDRRAAPPPTTTLPPEAETFFRADRLDGDAELDPRFSIVVGLEGTGTLAGIPFGRGTVALVPYGAGTVALRGDVRALRASPGSRSAGSHRSLSARSTPTPSSPASAAIHGA